MKVQVANSSKASEASGFAGLCEELEFNRRSDGTMQALVPLQLPNSGASGDTRTFIATVPITLTGETTQSAKNRTRVLLKAALPYTAISPDVADDSVVANQFNSSRSGGEVSAHIVVSVPAAMAQDLNGNNGSTCQRGASAQLTVVLNLLLALLRANGAARIGALVEDVRNGKSVFTYTNPTLASLDFAAPGDFVSSGAWKGDLSTVKALSPLVSAKPINGVVGLDASNAMNPPDLNDPLMRGLMKFTPLDEGMSFPVYASRTRNT